jgi:hypothetical protein
MLESVALSGVENLRGVLWLQGECDASAGVAHEAYEMALEEFADAIWQDLGVPLIVAPISRRTLPTDTCLGHPRIDTINAATLAAAADHARILLGPRIDDLPLEADCTHVHDVVALGERWYDAVSEALPACNDGLDNDGDGLFDVGEDIGCPGPMGSQENPICQDGIDNDGDGHIDFDGGAAANGGVPLGDLDPQCATPSSGEHPSTPCGIGAELSLAVGALMRRRRRLV